MAASNPRWDAERAHLTTAFTIEAEYADPPPLATFPTAVQHKFAVQDALNCLLAVRPNYATISSTPLPTYALSRPHLQNAHPDITPFLARVLPLASHHAAVKVFVEETRLAHAAGHVHQALGVAFADLLSDYNAFLLRLENFAMQQDLTLQKLLFYIQPTARSMALLNSVATACAPLRGGAALDALYNLAVSFVGSDDAKHVLAFLLTRAAEPLLDIIATWIGTGVIDDPFAEFFIVEDPSLATGAVSMDDKSWDFRFTVNWSNVPHFLQPFVESIMCAGKYLNVLRECRVDIQEALTQAQVMLAEKLPPSHEYDPQHRFDRLRLSGQVLMGPDASTRLARIVDRAFKLSSSALMTYLEKTSRLKAKLQSLRRYFLIQQGDYLVHFLDAAHSELSKKKCDVSRSRLVSLLELSIRSSVSSNDAFHDDLSCELATDELSAQISSLSTLGVEDAPDVQRRPSVKREITGYESFSLTFKTEWPASVVISMMDIIKYQFMFRYVFYCKHVEYELVECWRHHAQAKRPLRKMPSSFVRSFALRNRMMQFVRNMLYYSFVDVLEPNWRTMQLDMAKATTVDDIMRHHHTFLDVSSTQSLLSNEKHLKVLKNIGETCISFCVYTGRFTDMFRSREHVEQLEEELRERGYAKMLAKFETAFDMHLGNLLDGLSAVSKKGASEHLANLCDKLDVGGYYTRHKERSLASLGSLAL